MVRVRMAPIPVVGLLPFAGVREFVGLFVVVGQVDAPGAVLVIIPVMVILVARIVEFHLNAVVFRSRHSHNCNRSRKGSDSKERTKGTTRETHIITLQEKLSTFSIGSARSEGLVAISAFGIDYGLPQLSVSESIMKVVRLDVCALLHVFPIFRFLRGGAKALERLGNSWLTSIS
jgi:hypothetical protein